MWIFTRYGFFSIACATGADGALDANTVMLRSRLREHLLSLKARFPETELGKAVILSSDHTDYRYRIVLPKTIWVAALAELATEQTWSNFKNEAAKMEKLKGWSHRYVTALHRVWDIMFDLQEYTERADCHLIPTKD
jgi:hypothetical protein